MRIIVDHDVLRQFERKTGAVFGLLQTVVDAVTPLNPTKLPNRSHWTNRLVEWRKRRNQADYSPYPEGDLHVLAKQILLEAETFLDLCASFLKGRGVPYV